MNAETLSTTGGSNRNDDKPPRHRPQKLTAPLDPRRTMIFEGIDSTMAALIAASEEFTSHAKAFHRQGIEAPTFLQILRDQANR